MWYSNQELAVFCTAFCTGLAISFLNQCYYTGYWWRQLSNVVSNQPAGIPCIDCRCSANSSPDSTKQTQVTWLWCFQPDPWPGRNNNQRPSQKQTLVRNESGSELYLFDGVNTMLNRLSRWIVAGLTFITLGVLSLFAAN